MRDTRGEPLGDATVSVYSGMDLTGGPTELLGQVRTSEDGYYAWEESAALSQMALRVRKSGYCPAGSFHRVDLGREVRSNFTLQDAVASISGRVLDVQSRPIAGAVAAVTFPSDLSGRSEANVHSIAEPAVSDGDGVFTIADLPAGRAIVVVSAEGYLPRDHSKSVALHPGDQPSLTFTLEKGATLRIGVQDSEGNAIPSAYAYAAGFSIASADDYGSVKLTVPPTGQFSLTIGAEGFQKSRIQGSAENPPSSVTLEPLPRLRGIVFSNSGRRLADALVTAVRSGTGELDRDASLEDPALVNPLEGKRVITRTKTDLEGYFSLPRPTQSATIVAAKSGFVTQRIELDSDRPETEAIDFHLPPATSGIYGRVLTPQTVPVQCFCVLLQKYPLKSESYYTYDCFANQDGSFAELDLPAGYFSLSVWSCDTETRATASLDVMLSEHALFETTVTVAEQ